MSHVDIKQVIASLSRILELASFSTITPEDFRLAKFNKHEAVIVLVLAFLISK